MHKHNLGIWVTDVSVYQWPCRMALACSLSNQFGLDLHLLLKLHYICPVDSQKN